MCRKSIPRREWSVRGRVQLVRFAFSGFNRLMIRRSLIVSLLIASACLSQEAPSTQPVAAPIDPTQWVDVSTEDLAQRAREAHRTGELPLALAMYKELAVRTRKDPNAVKPYLAKVKEIEQQLGPQAQVVEGINAPRTPHEPFKADEVREITLQKLGNFDYDSDKGGNIPDDVKALTGGVVKLRGFMLPLQQTDRITEFVLVPDLFGCCFGQPPSLQHTAVIRTPAGKSVAYYPDAIVVTGKLTVKETTEEGFIVSVFQVDTTSVKPAE